MAAVAFLVSMGLEFELEKNYPENKENYPVDGQFRLDLYNGLGKGCQIALTVDGSRVPEDRFPHMFEDSHHLIAWTLADDSPPSCGLEDGEMDVFLPEEKVLWKPGLSPGPHIIIHRARSHFRIK